MSTFPDELPEPNQTIGPISHHGTAYTFRGIADGHWIIDGPQGIQTEIRKNSDGTLSMIRTDGRTSNEGIGDNWEELAAQYF
jgi:hypothetical protein